MSNNSNITSEEQYQQFVKVLEEALDGIAEVVRTEVTKVNEVKQALSIRYPGEEVSPTIYPDDIFRKMAPGEGIENAAKSCAQRLIEMKDMAPKLSDIDLSPEGARKNMYCMLINADKNAEMLKDTPHIMMEDLALVIRYRVNPEASFLVHDNHLATFKMTESEAMEIAQKNTDASGYTIQTMGEVLGGMMRENGASEEMIDDMFGVGENEMMYVVSNQSKVHGAYAIASKEAMEQAAEKIGSDFYILPSSIHECILVPERADMDPASLKSMVEEVNATQVEIGEQLSDNIYRYDALTKSVKMVDVEKMAKTAEVAEVVKSSAMKM